MVTPLLLVWGGAGFLFFRKKNYSAIGTLFSLQNWGLWLAPIALTVTTNFQFIGWKLAWSFRGNASAMTLLWSSEILCFIGVLFVFTKGLDQPFVALGFFKDKLLFRCVYGLRLFAALHLLFALILFGLLDFVSVDRLIQHISALDLKNGNIIGSAMTYFEVRWGSVSLLIPFFYFIIYGSIQEEIIFRGFLYGPIRKKLGPLYAMILTSVLFISIHFGDTRAGLFHVFLLGILYVFLYEKTQSLIPGILVHAISNSFLVYNYFRGEIELSSSAIVQNFFLWNLFIVGVVWIGFEGIYRWMLKKGSDLKLPRSLGSESIDTG